MTRFRALARWHGPFLAGLLLLLSGPALAAGTTIRGVVLGGAQAPLVGVRVTADEVGISRDTDSKGQFSLTIPPEVANKGLVRLSFSLRDHQTQNEEVKLPLSKRLEVILTPLYARTFQPTIPPGLASRLRIYRKGEISRVHAFLGSPEKKLLSVEGMAGVGAEDLVLVALQDVPTAARRPILWWDCEETDSLNLLTQEWARVFRDPNLGNLAQRQEEVEGARERREVDLETLARLMARLERNPYNIVLNRFDRWLSASGQEIEDAALEDFVVRVVASSYKGKMILVSEEKLPLHSRLNSALVQSLGVKGFNSGHASDFLQNHLGLSATSALVQESAIRLGGHPVALQLLAESIASLEPKAQDNRLRQFLQVGDPVFDGNSLAPLLMSSYERLSSREETVLGLLAVVRQPLSARMIQEIDISRESLFTSEEVQRSLDRLARSHFWVESYVDNRSSEQLYQVTEIARPFLLEQLEADIAWRTELHRRALGWYKQAYLPLRINLFPAYEPILMAGYTELIRQAFFLAELTYGKEREDAVFVGSRVAIQGRVWHVQRDSVRLSLSQFEWAVRLLKDLEGAEAEFFRAECLLYSGNLYARMNRSLEAEDSYRRALPLYRSLKHRRGEADVLRSFGSLYYQLDKMRDAEEYYGEASTIYESILDLPGQAEALSVMGKLCERTNRLQEARRNYLLALDLYSRVDDKFGEARTLAWFGELLFRTNNFSEARKRYERAGDLYELVGSRIGEAKIFWHLGDLYGATSRWPEAEENYKSALRLYSSLEDARGQADLLKSIAHFYSRAGRLEEAGILVEEALRAYKDIRYRLGEANALRLLGDFMFGKSDFREAEKLYGSALDIYVDLESDLGKANVHASLGELYFKTGRLIDAEKSTYKALGLFKSSENNLGAANALRLLGEVKSGLGNFREAEPLCEEALKLFRSTAYHLGEAEAIESLGWIYLKTDRTLEAGKHFEQALELYKAFGDKVGEADSLLGLGAISVALGKFDEAESQYKVVLETYSKNSQAVGQFECRLYLADLYIEKRRLSEAFREIFSAFLIGTKFGLLQMETSLVPRVVTVREKSGPETFKSIVAAAVKMVPIKEREALIAQLSSVISASEQ